MRYLDASVAAALLPISLMAGGVLLISLIPPGESNVTIIALLWLIGFSIALIFNLAIGSLAFAGLSKVITFTYGRAFLAGVILTIIVLGAFDLLANHSVFSVQDFYEKLTFVAARTLKGLPFAIFYGGLAGIAFWYVWSRGAQFRFGRLLLRSLSLLPIGLIASFAAFVWYQDQPTTQISQEMPVELPLFADELYRNEAAGPNLRGVQFILRFSARHMNKVLASCPPQNRLPRGPYYQAFPTLMEQDVLKPGTYGLGKGEVCFIRVDKGYLANQQRTGHVRLKLLLIDNGYVIYERNYNNTGKQPRPRAE